jgi:hypothetical protein
MAAGCQWLTLVILATWETEIRGIEVRKIHKITTCNMTREKWTGVVTQVVEHLQTQIHTHTYTKQFRDGEVGGAGGARPSLGTGNSECD